MIWAKSSTRRGLWRVGCRLSGAGGPGCAAGWKTLTVSVYTHVSDAAGVKRKQTAADCTPTPQQIRIAGAALPCFPRTWLQVWWAAMSLLSLTARSSARPTSSCGQVKHELGSTISTGEGGRPYGSMNGDHSCCPISPHVHRAADRQAYLPRFRASFPGRLVTPR
eukprot:CAMPEP_0181203376 /NCGR_PEP_ID=MMETSP1096-20121128/19350_1 /TAXON_ID=156174 ORGANISM="Chrysochromulina ericina, Strain CCMP281" /NCGR_SAMPLE_ID=MMETSP1096 /ASSEMBLY_ACC=CAM_ASM_000453 /LENGTH=164 /DNA_ID=CAMNT_0023293967 /DNA_START=80 /DNA_END=571 /DNA_ORIENTATION=-